MEEDGGNAFDVRARVVMFIGTSNYEFQRQGMNRHQENIAATERGHLVERASRCDAAEPLKAATSDEVAA
jgi:hypothetical protein